jgi:Luciferase
MIPGAQDRICQVLLTWEGISAVPHHFGGIEFRLGSREIGHTHGDTLVDIPFPTRIRDEVVESGLAEPHHILPGSGWISFYLRHNEDVEAAIGLFERSYEIARHQLPRSL